VKTILSSRRHQYLAMASIFLVTVALIAGMVGCGSNGDEVIHFADPNLEAEIRQAILKPEGDIYASELASLTQLTARDAGIKNLSGLEYCTGLSILVLSSNKISDISPLANLTGLTYLNLNSNNISNVSFMANLTNLTYLNFGNNQITDISAVANLINLTEFRIQYNQITDISPLVQNEGISTGDRVHLEENPLSSDSKNIYIPALQSRGVTVYY